ncbi:tetratricopeptide repeat protein [Rhodothermus profundi]|uniref:Beta-barrel assembly machine subunit BamD n=1 Tax=Rhodothermus profundi TaxID=633813 RepID=A0A1M6P613_9BACT|nr:tetratricopeptide repeat protein [Rhodothermus profundi]SHK03316.1 Beta-barrel assembly machine subunit BamD [Rhodothermus profundi]
MLRTAGWLSFLSVLLSVPVILYAQPAPPGPEASFAHALALHSDGFYTQAAQAFAQFRSIYPNDTRTAEALFYEAEARLALGQTDEAAALLRLFAARYPTHPLVYEAQLALGKYFFDMGQYEQARQAFRQALRPGVPDAQAARALFWMAEAAQRLARPSEAMGYYRRLADTYPHTRLAPQALLALAYTQVETGAYDEAARTFEVLAARYPNAPEARHLGLALAQVYYELGDYRRTIEEVERRLPDLHGQARQQAWLLLAESYNQLRDSENAIVYYRRVLENPASPYYRQALYGLAWNYYFEGVYQWAADHFQQVREGQRDTLAMKATYYEAVCRKLAHEPQQALELFKTVVLEWPDSPLAPHAQFERALLLYEMRRWEAAHDAFDFLVRTYADSELLGDALRMRGYTAIALGRFDEALESFDRAIALQAASPRLRTEIAFQKAWLHYRQQNYAAASSAFMELYQQDPRGPKAGDALFWAAESFYQLDQLERAEALFQEYLRHFPNGAHVEAAHYALGWVYFRQQRYEAAIQSFQRFLQAYRRADEAIPYRLDALLRLADSYYALKRYPEAIRYYQQAATEGASDYARYQIGQAYYNAGNYEEALRTFNQLLAEHPESTWREEALYQIGYIHFLNQEYDQAIAAYRRLIELAPDDPLAAKAQYGIGDALFNAGRLEAAINAYKRVLERYPRSPFVADAATSIHFALIAAGKEARAEALIDSFATAYPNTRIVDELRFRRAEALYRSGRSEEAMQALETFVRGDHAPDLMGEALYYLATLYMEQELYDQAERTLQQLLATYAEHPRVPEAWLLLGAAQLKQERYEAALQSYQRLVTLAAQRSDLMARAFYGQIVALLELGRLDEARQVLTQAQTHFAANALPPVLLLAHARLADAAGQFDEAERLYRRVVSRAQDETGAEALYRLGALLLRRGDPHRAIEELSRLPTLFPGYAEWLARGYLTQARAFLTLGQRGEAARLYELVIAEFPNTSFARIAAQEKATL